MDKLKPCCRNCKYLGRRVEHLNNYNNVDEWRDCDFPYAWHITQTAIPMEENAGKDCKCFEAIKAWNTRALKEIDEGEIANFLFESDIPLDIPREPTAIPNRPIEQCRKLAKAITSTFGQREIRLPERIEVENKDYMINHRHAYDELIDRKWNKCIDKVIELNKEG